MSRGNPPAPQTAREIEARNSAIRKLARRRPLNNPPQHLGHALQLAATENA